MGTFYIVMVGILMALAISGLVVGVANDAINFLNSAVGSKAAPRRVILAIASIGMIVGALTSGGMMEVARSGVFHPDQFTFEEIMMLFLGVMFANVILLDLFNTFGLPTSTTVSLVFGLLGAGLAAATVKIAGNPELTMANLGSFINSGSTLGIVSGILLSVALAFAGGSIIMYITRIIFTFRYAKIFRNFGYLWCGIAFTAIVYFAIFKGLKSSGLISKEFTTLVNSHMLPSLLLLWLGCSALLAVVQHVFKANILKLTILAGTFSLALAFAGNDLVNFIGVPIAGYDAWKIAEASPEGANTLMTALKEPVQTDFLLLVAAGVIMVITLCTSKKAKTVADTEINLAKQDEGAERFGSTMMSRSMVRAAVQTNKAVEKVVPDGVLRFINRRFIPLRQGERVANEAEKAPFDMIRATVNLTVASILISIATNMKLPLSTTYVTFMVAMGSSLADRAWGRESAVYRITGVLTVITGWFITALVAFVLALGVTFALSYGGFIAVGAITLLCVWMLIHSSRVHRKREGHASSDPEALRNAPDVMDECLKQVSDTMTKATEIYKKTIMGIFKEDRRALRHMVKDSNELFYQARERKYAVVPTLQMLQAEDVDSGHYYIQAVDYMSEMTKALVHITRPSYDHIDNQHEGLSEEQMEDLMSINDEVSAIYDKINAMLAANDFTDIQCVMRMRDNLFEKMDDAIRAQLKRIKSKRATTKSSMLYLNILNETKTMVLQSRNLLKSQKYFIEKQ